MKARRKIKIKTPISIPGGQPTTLRFFLAGILLVLACLAGAGTVQQFDGGELTRSEDASYFAASPGALAEVKTRLAAHDESLQPALKLLIREAHKALETAPPTVMDKSKVPPSGDKHDYMSTAPYFWPDPNKPDGLPYVRHDGKVNPESRQEAFDRERIGLMTKTVETLALAYYFTGNEAYADHAAKCLRVWFLDPATRMNPNLKFAQAVPGENTGRGTGILEGRNISEVADTAGLLAGSTAWTRQDRMEFKSWLETYLHWLLTSKNGRAESNARNNHGSWYDVQAVELALVLGKVKVAKQICEAAQQKRIIVQIKPDGRQPLELTRTASFGYSHFNLDALFTLATMSEYTGVDLWHCQLANGRDALRAALDFLLPYVTDPSKQWPYEQIKSFDQADFAPQLRQAAAIYHDPEYEKILAGFPGAVGERFQLLYPAPVKNKPDVAVIDRERILKAAADALASPPITITKFRAKFSEGGPNDYYSNGDYWWPNPDTINGLPYVRRDGESNPRNFEKHRECLWQLRDAVTALGAAYAITGDDRYVLKAVELLRVFFLEPETRMNPGLQYAQAIPGVSAGRGIGIIDTLHLIGVPKAIEVMEKSPAFPSGVLAGLKQWFADYLEWMTTSKNGRDEANAPNNHAVAFWLQVAVFAQFVGNDPLLVECRQHYKQVFVPEQMALDGSFPRELARTKPYGYSIFQLDNMAMLCQVLSTTNDDLWLFTLPDGRGIRRAMEFLYPYLANKSRWPYQKDVEAWADWPTREPSLLFAGLAFHNQNYLNLWERLPADPTNLEVLRNIAIRQPILWLQNFSAADNPQTFSHGTHAAISN